MIKFQKFFIFSIVLVAVICGLGAFDAPAYIHCNHIGSCEFLDMVGIMGNSAKSQIAAMDRECNLSPLRSCNLTDLSLSALSMCVSARKKRRYLDFKDYFSVRYQDQGRGVFHLLDTHWIKSAVLSTRSAIAPKDILSPQVLQLVAISVIQS